MPKAGPLRALLIGAMYLLRFPAKSIRRFESCCERAFVLRNTLNNRVRLTLETCGSRHCPKCGRKYRSTIADRISNTIGRVRPNVWRFITLTLGHSDKSLSDQLDHLQNSFRRLRQTSLWQSTQLKGYGIMEVTFNHSSERWHPHLHILSRGNYLPQRSLTAQWLKCSGGSSITDIRKVSSSPRAAQYVAKYLGKLPNLLKCKSPGARSVEFLSALRNRKMLIPWGSPVIPEHEPPGIDVEVPADHWVIVGTLSGLLRRMKDGDVRASLILDALKGHVPILSSSSFIRDG